MDSKEEINSGGIAGRGDEAPESFRLAARVATDILPLTTTTTTQVEGLTMAAPQPASSGVNASTSAIMTTTPITGCSTNSTIMEGKKKRGRPRKYAPDGTISAALSPMPISASIPLSGDLSGWKQQSRVKPFQAIKKAHVVEPDIFGDKLAFLVGGNFTPHVITVTAGEDVAMKVHSFAQQESRAICVLSASGSVSNVTLRQPNSSGGTLTYEGRFEILSLCGSFMPTENGMLKSRSGGMSISLAGPDGRVLGGGLAGLLIAASPVQVVLGSFLPGHQLDQNPKKQRMEPGSAAVPSTLTYPFNQETGIGGSCSGVQNLNFMSPSLNHTDPFASMNSTHDSKGAETDDNLSSSSPEGESNDNSFSQYEITG